MKTPKLPYISGHKETVHHVPKCIIYIYIYVIYICMYIYIYNVNYFPPTPLLQVIARGTTSFTLEFFHYLSKSYVRELLENLLCDELLIPVQYLIYA